MFYRAMTVAAVAVLFLVTGAEGNEDSVDSSKTKKETRNLKRAYEDCETPDTTTESGMPVCEELCFEDNGNGPSVYQYEDKNGKPKASCVLKISQKSAKDCSKIGGLGLPAVGCEYLVVCLSCKGILQSDGVTPIDQVDDGWTLILDLDAALPGGQRTQPFPLTFVVGTPVNGQLDLKSTSLVAMQAILGTTAGIVPKGSVLNATNIELRDPLGRKFAK